jgi:hypothetical protein
MAVHPGTLCPVCRRGKEVLTSAFHGSGPPPRGRWAGLLDAVEPRFTVTTFPYLQTAHVCTWPSGSVIRRWGQYRPGPSTTARTRPLSVDWSSLRAGGSTMLPGFTLESVICSPAACMATCYVAPPMLARGKIHASGGAVHRCSARQPALLLSVTQSGNSRIGNDGGLQIESRTVVSGIDL